MEKKPATEGYQPSSGNIGKFGYQPGHCEQSGYQPGYQTTNSQTTSTVNPPQGGSNVNPPKKSE